MGERVDAALIARYLSGECSIAETSLVERWIAEHPEDRAAIESLRAVWESKAVRDVPEFDPDDALWRRIAGEMTRAATARLVSEPSTGEQRRTVRFAAIVGTSGRRVWWGASAAVAVAAAGLLVMDSRADRAAHEASSAAASARIREIATARGQRAQVYLSDGTHVLLAAASRLRFASRFGDRRDVFLQGEALFDVAHDSTRPFVVHAAHAVATDIGTRFNVRAYPEMRGVEVVVAEGAVSLQRAAATVRIGVQADSLILRAFDLGRLGAAGGLSVHRGVNLDARLAWTEGRLVFVGTPLAEVVQQLSRWYDVDIRLADSALAAVPVSATFPSEKQEHVLVLLAASAGARLERRGAAFVLSTDRP